MPPCRPRLTGDARYNWAMPAAANPVFANVAVLRIPGFDARGVGEQAVGGELARMLVGALGARRGGRETVLVFAP